MKSYTDIQNVIASHGGSELVYQQLLSAMMFFFVGGVGEAGGEGGGEGGGDSLVGPSFLW